MIVRPPTPVARPASPEDASAHPAIANFVRHGYTVEADEKPKQARARTK